MTTGHTPCTCGNTQSDPDESRERRERAFDLEFKLIRTRDELRAICFALRKFTESNAMTGMDEAGCTMVFGTLWLLEEVAESLQRAI